MEEKINKENVEDIIPLTSTQEGMLFYYISKPDSGIYHEQLSITLIGNIKADILQKSWNYVIQTNEMLRVIYRWKGIEKPIQIILKEHKLSLIQYDLTNENDYNKKMIIQNVKDEDLKNKIDITKETIRIYLCKIKENKYEMIISNHHIIYDGWSNGVILKELFQAYRAFNDGEEPVCIHKNKFKEFVKLNKSQDKEVQQEYWTRYLENLEVSNDFFESKGELNEKKIYINEFSKEKSEKIKLFSKENKVSLAAVLYCAWGILLQKLNNSNDILFGTTVSGRNVELKDIENMVGLFINTVPLRVKTNAEDSVYQLIQKIDSSIIERKQYEITPLIEIKECSNKGNGQNFFDSIVVIENYPLDLNMDEYEIAKIEEYSMIETTNYNMSLEIIAFKEIKLHFSYNNYAVDSEMVERISGYYENILNSIIEKKECKITEIEILNEVEKHKLIYELNNTYEQFPKDKTICQLFESQVFKTPNNIAIACDGKEITYSELNKKANLLARLLIDMGITANNVVGVMLERSIEMIIAILGILKAGGAYLPIDPDYPKERIKYILKDSQTKLIVTNINFINKIDFDGEVINIKDEKNYIGKDENVNVVSNVKDLAYVIYTSGSTGKPKGVMVEHRQVSNFISAIEKKLSLSAYKSILCLTTISFDIFLLETLAPLTKGLTVVIAKENEQIDGKKISEKIIYHDIEVMQITPSRLKILMEKEEFRKSIKQLRLLLIGGEALTTSIQNKLCGYPKLQIYNMYGPTETTVWSTIKEINGNEKITIGRPIANTRIYILNKNENLQPIGIQGEICIAGEGVARGYLNRPKLTSEKFINSPFIQGEMLYKTGDLGKWLKNGEIKFLGRVDHQVKIRGFRIELQEIESCLLMCEGIKEAVVIDREDKEGFKYLCAYLVSSTKIIINEIRERLSRNLPKYMLPAYFIQVDKMPLTFNGKIDRAALPEPLGNVLNGTKYEAPRNELEEKLVEIWCEVLEVKKLGINDTFFEVGGHSLKATLIISKIARELKVDIPLGILLQNPNITELSEYIYNCSKSDCLTISPVNNKEFYPTSAAHKRLFILQKLDPDNTSFNMTGIKIVKGKFDINKVEDTINKIIKRQGSLRTAFDMKDDEIVQIIHDELVIKVDYSEIYKPNIEHIIEDFKKPFNLSQLPLIRVKIVKIKEQEYLFLLGMHHIISDGASLDILINEFTQIYSGKNLNELKLQYKDFSVWQQQFYNSQQYTKQENHWMNVFEKKFESLNIPTDYQRPEMISFEGDSICFELDKETTLKLSRLSMENNVTMYTILLTAYNILLYKYSHQEDIIVGTPVFGRRFDELNDIIGMFINTIVMRNYPSSNKTFLSFMNEVKENALLAFENSDYQIELLEKKLSIPRQKNRNAIFDTIFVFQNINNPRGEVSMDELSFLSYEQPNRTSKLDLHLEAFESENRIEFALDYCTKLYKSATIERMSENYIKIIKAIIINPLVKISEIEIYPEESMKNLLLDDNYAEDIIAEFDF